MEELLIASIGVAVFGIGCIGVWVYKACAKKLSPENWQELLVEIIESVEDAEGLFCDGDRKRKWVLGVVQSMAQYKDIRIDPEVLEDLIYRLVEMSKVVNSEED